MTGSSLTVGDVTQHATTLAAMASALLTGLASGKYASDVAMTETILGDLGVTLPPAAMADEALKGFLFLNSMTAPRGAIVPDGHGGFVPASNSRFDPATGEFI